MNRTIRRALLVLLLASLPLATIKPRAGSPPNLLDFNGGPVLAHPAIHNVYMDSAWDSHNPAAINRASIDGFTASLVGSNYFARASQYGVGAASFSGSNQASILCPTPIVAGVTDFFSIGAWMQCMTNPNPLPFAGTLTGIPAPDSNTVYSVYIPGGTQINDAAFKSCGDFGAYHFFGSALVWSVVWTPFPTPMLLPQSFSYTVVPIDCTPIAGASPLDGVSAAATHEIIEASLDPIILRGWIDDSTAGFNANILKMGEASDICDGQLVPPVRLTNGLLVSAYWSNSDNACVPVSVTSALTANRVVWRPGTGTWFFDTGSGGVSQQWGQAGDIPVRGLYDSDALADIAVWRPSNGVWFVINSSTGTASARQWGQNGDIPVPKDYDGDGRTDFAVWRPSTGVWWIINSKTGAATARQWGTSGDVPVPGDYDGDKQTDLAVWRPSTGTWFVINSLSGVSATQWGQSGDIPVPADYDHDGKVDVAVWRPSTGVWWIINSSTGTVTTRQWGTNGDIPVPGDYDHDGRVDIAVWRPSSGTWFIIPSSTGQPVSFQWGMPGDVPIRPPSTLP